MELSFSDVFLVREGPLTYTDATVHENDAELVGIFKFESKLVIQDWIDGILEGHRRNV